MAARLIVNPYLQTNYLLTLLSLTRIGAHSPLRTNYAAATNLPRVRIVNDVKTEICEGLSDRSNGAVVQCR
jgi:hypothetical protein